MFCYQESVSKGTPKPCTIDIFNELIDSPKVKNICRAIAGLDPNADDYNDRKQALKKRLPIIIPHAASFANEKRVSADATPSGLAMLDVDHVENPREWFETLQRETIIENHIFLVAITASGKGLRIIGARAQGESIEQAQLRMAQALGIEEYDAVTKDLARASYVVPRDYILWMDETELFAEREWNDEPTEARNDGEKHGEADRPERSEGKNLEPLARLCRSSEAERRKEPLKPLEPLEPSSAEPEELSYKGLPYADIVEELMLQTGNAGGVVQGERNTVYFSLANYMRYICDFNA